MRWAHLDSRHCILNFLLKRPEARRVPAEQKHSYYASGMHSGSITIMDGWKMIYTSGREN